MGTLAEACREELDAVVMPLDMIEAAPLPPREPALADVALIILTFGGGVNEVQRDLIAVFGLGMPMAKR